VPAKDTDWPTVMVTLPAGAVMVLSGGWFTVLGVTVMVRVAGVVFDSPRASVAVNVTRELPASAKVCAGGVNEAEVAPSPKVHSTVTASPSGSVAVPAKVTGCTASMVVLLAGAVMSRSGPGSAWCWSA
jgi:hypothetical protein